MDYDLGCVYVRRTGPILNISIANSISLTFTESKNVSMRSITRVHSTCKSRHDSTYNSSANRVPNDYSSEMRFTV